MRRINFCLTELTILLTLTNAFIHTRRGSVPLHHYYDFSILNKGILFGQEKSLEPDDNNSDIRSIKESAKLYFPRAEYFILTLESHKPLGCTAEESLAIENDGAKHVFVSKVSEKGNAGMSGLQEGDVVVGLSGAFNDVVPVIGTSGGLDRIRSLITGRREEFPLTIAVARGTDVMSNHQTALIDLCLLPEENDTAMQNCLDVLFNEDDDTFSIDESIVDTEKDNDTMLDVMFDTWNDEMDYRVRRSNVEKNVEQKGETKSTSKSKPWASRSSGSGTYVRDPSTGKMVNIDEEEIEPPSGGWSWSKK